MAAKRPVVPDRLVVPKRLVVPRSFRGGKPDPLLELDAVKAYRPRSMVAQHKGLTVVFAILALALVAYFIKSIRASRPPPPAPPPSVYIDVVPPK